MGNKVPINFHVGKGKVIRGKVTYYLFTSQNKDGT